MVGIIGGCKHVIIHEETDFDVLFFGKLRDIVVGSEEAFLFSSPPGETHAVVYFVVGEVGGDFEEGQSSCTIVVDWNRVSKCSLPVFRKNAAS